MHRHRDVAEHRLRTNRCDDDKLILPALDRILQVPKASLGFDLLYFEIGDCGQQLRVPIDEPLVAIDESFLVKRDEHLDHRARQTFIHRETFAAPIARRTEPLQLTRDGSARLLLPGPDALDEFFAPERAAIGFLTLHQLPLDDHLGRDTGVVGAGLPQHILAAHALEPAKHVLQRVVEGVPHVQRSRHIRRRDDDAIGIGALALGPARLEGTRLFPGAVDPVFNFGRLVGFFEHDGPNRSVSG